MSEDERSTIQLVSDISQFNKLSEELADEDVNSALEYVIKLIAKPDVAPAAVGPLIVKIQGLAAKCAILGMYYINFEKGTINTPQGKKRNAYKTMAAELDKLVAALKYIGKAV